LSPPGIGHAYRDLVAEYRKLESEVDLQYLIRRVTYTAPVNFNGSLKAPRHRWYPYKEGFSPSFVGSFLERFASDEQSNILDPFAGVGTTILEASARGHHGVGVEISPLAFFVSNTKSLSLDRVGLDVLNGAMRDFLDSPLPEKSDSLRNETVSSYFQPAYLDAILRIRHFNQHLPKGPIQDLFKLALLSSLETFSTHRKAGNGLKRKSRLPYRNYSGTAMEQLKNSIHMYLKMYSSDLQAVPELPGTVFINGSSLEMGRGSYTSEFDCVLTSPPYANCFDYSKIYMCELWIGDFFQSSEDQSAFRMGSVRSHVHATWLARYETMGSEIVNEIVYPVLSREKLWSKQIPEMLRGYFMDLGRLFESLRTVVKPNGPVGIVVGNSAYGGLPIATDLLIADIAPRHGFRAEKIEVYRKIIPSSQQYMSLESKEFLRESMVILRRL
jgi:DNA modification methylase